MFSMDPIYLEDVYRVATTELPWDKLQGKSVFLTGASGLIGTFLVDVLMRRNSQFGLNLKIYALGRNELEAKARFKDYWNEESFCFLAMDINQPHDLPSGVDYIIHAASNTHPRQYATDPIGSIMTNILGLDNLLRYAVEQHITRFVFLSSVEIYGQALQAEDVFDESYCGYIDCNTLRAGYPEGKRAGEALCQAYITQYGLDIVIPRLSRIYGPTMKCDDSKALSQFIKDGVNKRNIILKSEGRQRYSYCYMADAVSGILYAWLLGKSGEAYNIAGADQVLTLRELVACVAKIAGTEIQFSIPNAVEQKGFSPVLNGVMSAKKLSHLGWKAETEIQKGLNKTITVLESLS